MLDGEDYKKEILNNRYKPLFQENIIADIKDSISLFGYLILNEGGLNMSLTKFADIIKAYFRPAGKLETRNSEIAQKILNRYNNKFILKRNHISQDFSVAIA